MERPILDVSQGSEYTHDASAVFLMAVQWKITVKYDLFNDTSESCRFV